MFLKKSIRRNIYGITRGGGEYRDNFDIQKIVDKYQSEFGSGCVKILLFEDIRKNPDRFYSALSEVLKVNKDQLINLMCRGGFLGKERYPAVE